MCNIFNDVQKDAGSDMKSRTSGISLATRIRSIQRGQGLIEQPWLAFGRRPGETSQFMTKQNSLA